MASTSAAGACVYAIRGGKDDDKNETSTAAAGDISEIESESTSSPTLNLWSAGSLYRMNEDAMADAQSRNESDVDIQPSKDNTIVSEKGAAAHTKGRKKSDTRHHRDDQSTRNDRNGVLTADATPVADEENGNSRQPWGNGGNIFRWLNPGLSAGGAEGSVDTDKRKNTNTNDHQLTPKKKDTELFDDDKEGDSAKKTKAQADLAQLWWVNMWSQQQQEQQKMPDAPGKSDNQGSSLKETKRSKESPKFDDLRGLDDKHDGQKKRHKKASTGKSSKKQSRPHEEVATVASVTDSRKDTTMPIGTGLTQNYDKVKNVTSLLAQVSEPQEVSKDYISTGYVSNDVEPP